MSILSACGRRIVGYSDFSFCVKIVNVVIPPKTIITLHIVRETFTARNSLKKKISPIIERHKLLNIYRKFTRLNIKRIIFNRKKPILFAIRLNTRQ